LALKPKTLPPGIAGPRTSRQHEVDARRFGWSMLSHRSDLLLVGHLAWLAGRGAEFLRAGLELGAS